MRSRSFTLVVSAVSALALSVLSSATASAAPLLAVDFNNDGNPGAINNTQAGFTALVVGANATSFSGPVASYTVSLAGISGSRIREDPPAANPGAGIYKDFVFLSDNNDTTTDSFTLAVAALQPLTEYDVRFYHFDGNQYVTRVQTYSPTPATGTVGTTQVATFSQNDPATLQEKSVVVRLTTNASGTFSYTVTGSTGSNQFPVLNGFEVSAVPEPASVGLLMGGCALLLRRGRRA